MAYKPKAPARSTAARKPKKKKSLASKANKVRKTGAKIGLAGSGPTGLAVAAATKRKGRGKKRKMAAARHMAAGTQAKGRKVKKVLKKATARKAAGGPAFVGKKAGKANRIASGGAAKKSGTKGIKGMVKRAVSAARSKPKAPKKRTTAARRPRRGMGPRR